MKPVTKFKIASPCNVRWEDMTGDERSRFCGQCEKHVYNFSKMSSEEMSKLVAEKKGNLCVRFFQRTDGTVLLENCPVGAERAFKKIKVLACSIIAAFVFSAGAWFASARPSTRTETYSRVQSMWDEAMWTMKGWMGIRRPVALMGEICVLPAPVAVPSQNSASK